jgi:hypothetical protein
VMEMLRVRSPRVKRVRASRGQYYCCRLTSYKSILPKKMHLPTSLIQSHVTVASSSLHRTVPIDVHGPQSQPPFNVNINNVLQSPIPRSSLSFSVVNIQHIIKTQSSRTRKHISEISLESAFSNVILKCRNLIPVFPIEWFSCGYQSLNLDASILLSPETFCQQSTSSQHPCASLLCQRLSQTLSLASYFVPCQLSFKPLA